MKKLVVLLVFVGLLSFVHANKKVSHKGTLEYIQKTGKLRGVVQVKINADKSVSLFDAKQSGYGYRLTMRDYNRKIVNSVNLKNGQFCSLSDGRHVFVKYKFKKLEKGKIIFIIIYRFDARSFGDGIKKETKTIAIAPYKNVIVKSNMKK